MVAAAVVTTLWVTVSVELTGGVTSVAALAQPPRAPDYRDDIRTDDVGLLPCRTTAFGRGLAELGPPSGDECRMTEVPRRGGGPLPTRRCAPWQ